MTDCFKVPGLSGVTHAWLRYTGVYGHWPSDRRRVYVVASCSTPSLSDTVRERERHRDATYMCVHICVIPDTYMYMCVCVGCRAQLLYPFPYTHTRTCRALTVWQCMYGWGISLLACICMYVWDVAPYSIPLRPAVATGTGERLAFPSTADCGRRVPRGSGSPRCLRQPANTRVPTTGHWASSESGHLCEIRATSYITHNIERAGGEYNSIRHKHRTSRQASGIIDTSVSSARYNYY